MSIFQQAFSSANPGTLESDDASFAAMAKDLGWEMDVDDKSKESGTEEDLDHSYRDVEQPIPVNLARCACQLGISLPERVKFQ